MVLPAYTTYALYNRDMELSLKRVANDPVEIGRAHV